jgi:hypothetical protein
MSRIIAVVGAEVAHEHRLVMGDAVTELPQASEALVQRVPAPVVVRKRVLKVRDPEVLVVAVREQADPEAQAELRDNVTRGAVANVVG